MTITSLTAKRVGQVVFATAVSNLSGTVYYHWYLDGTWQGSTTSGTRAFRLADGDSARLDVQDTTNAAYDPIANAPAGYPARRTLFWTRSTDADVVEYVVEQQQDGGSWTEIRRVPQLDQWSFEVLTPRLVDLSTYSWRVTPYDAAGNAGTALTLETVKVVRTPDAPDFGLAFDGGTTRVTWSAA